MIPGVPNPTKAELAWAAGYLDGEGCFYAGETRSGNYARFQCSIGATQALEEPQRKLYAMFGGFVDPVQKSGNRKLQWLWRVAGTPSCQQVSTLLIPYLVVKREQAELMLEFCSTFTGRSGIATPLPVLENRRRLITALAQAKK